jgi:uncharacterized membrane protein YccF (DUF307 family)
VAIVIAAVTLTALAPGSGSAYLLDRPLSRPQARWGLRLILNLIWLVLAGFWLALLYAFFGILAFILIITIPFGFACFRIAGFALWPFGRRIVRRPSAGAPSLIGNIIWVVLFGWELALAHLITGIALCLTIIGIPLGLANFKLIPISLLPLGTEIVHADDPRQFV